METTIQKNNFKYSILTPSGWSDFYGIRSKSVDHIIEFTLSNNKILRCTNDHQLKSIFGFIEAKLLNIGDILEPNIAILNKKIINEKTIVYDPVEIKNNSEYFANKIINHNCSFVGSSGTLIGGWKLKQLKYQIPLFKHDGLSIYKTEEQNHKYIIVADVSEGKGLDNSAFNVVDVTAMPFEQVATFYSNIVPPEELAQILHMTAKRYNEAPVLIEYENLGPVVSHSLFYDFEYENLLCTESAGSLGKRISMKGGAKIDKGLKMSPVVRKIGCSLLKLLVENDKLIINDYDTIFEMNRFSRKNNRYEAESGNHDDLVMALVSFAWLSDQSYFKDYTDINTLSHLREKTQDQLLNELVPFGFVDRGTEPPPPADDPEKVYNWLYPDQVDVEWLPNF